MISRWTNRGWAYKGALYIVLFGVLASATTAGVMKILNRTTVAYWWYLPHVPEVIPDYRYVIEHYDKNDPLYLQRSNFEFCSEDDPIPFDEGEMLQFIEYKERGKCKEIIHYKLESKDGTVIKK